MIYALVALAALFFLMIFFFCASFEKMKKLEKSLIAEGKDVPEYITKRKEQIKICYEKWQRNSRKAFLICVILIIVILLLCQLF